MAAPGVGGSGGCLVARLMRWSWIAASVLGGATLALLFFQVDAPADLVRAFLLAVSYPLVLLPMFLLNSVVQGRLWRMVVASVLAALALLFCSVLLIRATSEVDYALEVAWTVALATAVTLTWAAAVRRLSPGHSR